MNKPVACLLALGVVGVFAGGVLLSGCEGDGGGAEAGDSFRIEPAQARLSVETHAMVLTAVGGSEPFVWVVTDPSMGAVTGTNRVVTYTRTDAVGANVVQVTDSRQWRASATVYQPAVATEEEPETIADLTVSASPASLAANGNKAIVSAAGGTPPYRWSVLDVALGHVVSATGDSVVYVRDRAGQNVVTVSDSAGRAANILINQP